MHGKAGACTLFVLMGLSLVGSLSPPGFAEQGQTNEMVTGAGTRGLLTKQRTAEVRVLRRNLPLSITDIRNLQDTNWLERMEIEVKNNSAQPIYFLRVGLAFPDVPKTPQGLTYGFSVTLGRWELWDWQRVFVGPGDAPVALPGETCVLRIPDNLRKGLQKWLGVNGLSESSVKKVVIAVQSASFGDGTGV